MICPECGCYMLCGIVAEIKIYKAKVRCLKCGYGNELIFNDINETDITKVRDIIRERFNNEYDSV